MKITKKITKYIINGYIYVEKNVITFKIIYDMQYRVANFYHAWLCNVRGCDCPEHNSMTYVFLESIVNYKLGDTLLKI